MTESDLIVMVVDDDLSVVRAICRLLRSAGLKAQGFATPGEFLKTYDPHQTGCIVLDLTMPDFNGLELQRLLHEKGGAPPIVFLTGTADIPQSVRAMKDGAVDFLTKPIDDAVLLRTIRAALAQERAARQDRMTLIETQSRLRTLTPREREVFEHVVSGQLNKQIAADLGTVEKTIKVHRARVMEKMGAESLAELVQLAQRVGLHGTWRRDPHKPDLFQPQAQHKDATSLR